MFEINNDIQELDDAIVLLKNEFFKTNVSSGYQASDGNHFFYGNISSIEAERNISKFELRYFEKTEINEYKVLGTIFRMRNGLFYTEGKIMETLPDSKTLFNTDTAKQIISLIK